MADETPLPNPEDSTVEKPDLIDPWLIATWPGMGGVGINAAGYLIEAMGMELIGEFAPQEIFEVQQVDVKGGIGRAARLPRSMIFQWKDPAKRRDLLVFVGEAQPPAGGWQLCRRIAEYAAERGVKRVFTFAAMATQLHPASMPRVVGVVTQGDDLPLLTSHGSELLKEGQVSGMNGVMLAAADEEGLPAVGLLGELPFFAVGVPNPRASLVVLEVFASMAGLDLDLSRLREKGDEAEEGLLSLFEHLKEAGSQGMEGELEAFDPETAVGEADDETASEAKALDQAVERRIEELFEEARKDRSQAFKLKTFLDRHGAFDQFEDRFLDLFHKGE